MNGRTAMFDPTPTNVTTTIETHVTWLQGVHNTLSDTTYTPAAENIQSDIADTIGAAALAYYIVSGQKLEPSLIQQSDPVDRQQDRRERLIVLDQQSECKVRWLPASTVDRGIADKGTITAIKLGEGTAQVKCEKTIMPQTVKCAILAALGMSNAEIEAILGITKHTVDSYLSYELEKGSASNRLGFAKDLMQRGLIVPFKAAPAPWATVRQKQIAEGLAHGMTNRTIAKMLGYSMQPIFEEVRKIRQNAGLRNREQIPLTMILHNPTRIIGSDWDPFDKHPSAGNRESIEQTFDEAAVSIYGLLHHITKPEQLAVHANGPGLIRSLATAADHLIRARSHVFALSDTQAAALAAIHPGQEGSNQDTIRVLSEREQIISSIIINTMPRTEWFSAKDIDLSELQYQRVATSRQALLRTLIKLIEHGTLITSGAGKARKYHFVE